jgi:hypothetical protein
METSVRDVNLEIIEKLPDPCLVIQAIINTGISRQDDIDKYQDQ